MAFLIHGMSKRGQNTYMFIQQIGIHPYNNSLLTLLIISYSD